MKYVEVERDTSAFQQPLLSKEIFQLCERHFHVLPTKIEALHTGKFNTSYRLRFEYRAPVILRVAPPAGATLFNHEKELLRREHAIQQHLNQLQDIFPTNLAVDFSHSLINRDYVFQNMLPGELWSALEQDLTAEQNLQLWCELSGIVRQIHQVENDRFGFPAPHQQYDRWSEAMLAWLEGMVTDLETYGLDAELAKQLLYSAEKGQDLLDQVTTATLVHGDLWPKNILITNGLQGPRISGVLDAERGFWAEPSAEWIFSFLDIPQPFWFGYGRLSVNDASRFRKLIYEGRGAVQLCLEAWRFGFDGAFAHRLLARTTEQLATFFRRGRRSINKPVVLAHATRASEKASHHSLSGSRGVGGS